MWRESSIGGSLVCDAYLWRVAAGGHGSAANILFPYTSQHEFLKTRRKLMDTAEVMILENHSTAHCLDAERIACAVPADDENTSHRPAAWWAKLAREPRVSLGEANNVVHLLR